MKLLFNEFQLKNIQQQQRIHILSLTIISRVHVKGGCDCNVDGRAGG